jgi:hypothetical protein
MDMKKFCENCGGSLEGCVNFCESCGHRIESTSQQSLTEIKPVVASGSQEKKTPDRAHPSVKNLPTSKPAKGTNTKILLFCLLIPLALFFGTLLIIGAFFGIRYYVYNSQNTPPQTSVIPETPRNNEIEVRKTDTIRRDTPRKTNVTPARGNTTGNLVNDGLVAESNGVIFYAENYDGGIFRISPDGRKEKLATGRSNNLSVVGDWIYYYNYQNMQISKIPVTGGTPTSLLEMDISCLYVLKDRLYFNREKIYTMDINAQNFHSINDHNSMYMNIVGDWIYYSNEDDEGKIYKIRTDSTGETKLNNVISSFLNVVDDEIFFINNEQRSGIYKISINGGNASLVCEMSSLYLNVSGDWIYFSSLDDKDRLYKVRRDGSNLTRISPDGSCSINIIGDWVYYQNLDNQFILTRIRNDGSNKEIVY